MPYRWDLCCCEDAQWQAAVHDCKSERGAKQPFYHILLDIATLGASNRQDLQAAGLTNFTAYVPEDALSAPSVSLFMPLSAAPLPMCPTTALFTLCAPFDTLSAPASKTILPPFPCAPPSKSATLVHDCMGTKVSTVCFCFLEHEPARLPGGPRTLSHFCLIIAL